MQKLYIHQFASWRFLKSSCIYMRMKELKKMYKNEDTPIYVSGKVLKNKEIDEIQEIIKDR